MDDPINLSIGQAHFDVPEAVKEAAIAAIRDGFNRYTVTEGVPELNERILGTACRSLRVPGSTKSRHLGRVGWAAAGIHGGARQG